MKKTSLTIALSMLTLFICNAQTTISPTDDMTTNTGTSGMAPTIEQLWIANWSAMQNYQQSMLKFDLSPYEGQTINSANLKINQFFHAPDGTPTPAKIYLISEDWDENSWPTNANITHAESPSVSIEFTSTLGWYSIDVTELINATESKSEHYGFVIIAETGSKFAEFYSKDATEESNRPYLELDFSQGIENNSILDIQIYPNPVNDIGWIEFELESTEDVNISIVNILGKTVRNISKGQLSAGGHRFSFDTNTIPEGIYFVSIISDSKRTQHRFIIN